MLVVYRRSFLAQLCAIALTMRYGSVRSPTRIAKRVGVQTVKLPVQQKVVLHVNTLQYYLINKLNYVPKMTSSTLHYSSISMISPL